VSVPDLSLASSLALTHVHLMRTWMHLGLSVALVACGSEQAGPAADGVEQADRSTGVPTSRDTPPPSACEVERAELEREIAAALDQTATDTDVTSSPDFTLALESADGHRFVHSHGDSTLDSRYESASTSKWVAAAVILDVVDQGLLSLADEPSDWLPYWEVRGVTLAQLLSFTSGFSQEPLCINLPNADFADCVERAYELSSAGAPAPGSSFDYSSTHLQVAGLMAVRAAGVRSWAELFADWKARTGLFPTGAFDLPSRENPRLAGGMHWSGKEYLDFLLAIRSGSLLQSTTRTAMLGNQRRSASVAVAASPILAALNQDWAYGFGNWLECPSALGPNSFDCGPDHRNSSPGAYGAYPFIDFDHGYVGILSRQGALGTFREGAAVFAVVAEQAARWADACSRG
jgi:CubicO group peptidase (beta-lactamase class C family)